MSEVGGLLLLLVGFGLLGATGTLVACCLRLRSPIELVLAAYLVAWAWLVAACLALSPGKDLGRTSLLVALAVGCALAAGGWRASGRPPAPSFRPAVRAFVDAVRHPAVLVLASALSVAACYAVALAVLTPMNDWDALSYHATRAALWLQAGGVGYIENPIDARLNANPPNAEIGQLATMLLSGNDRWATLPQLLAYGALVVGVAGIARRASLGTREAIFAALVFASLPVVVLQASTGLNDLVVASFLVAATYFCLAGTRAGLVLAALAVALAIGTKFTALLALPAVALVAAAGTPIRRWPGLLLAGGAGLAAGSTWYVLNVVETGDLDGGFAEEAAQRAELSPSAIVTTAVRLTVGFVDMSGSGGGDPVPYLVAAALLCMAGAVRLRSSRAQGLALIAGAAVTAVWASTLEHLGNFALRGTAKLWMLLGSPHFAWPQGDWRVNTLAHPLLSGYGPLLPVLIGVTTVLAVVGAMRRTSTRLVVALALSPWVLLVTVAATLVWDPFRERFLILGIALASATWGLLLRWSMLASVATALGATSLVVVLANHELKPTGVPYLSRAEAPPSVWGRPRWYAQSMSNPGLGELFKLVEERIPANARVGVAFSQDTMIFPVFGPDLDRRVSLVSARGGRAPDDVDWLVLDGNARVRRCASAWRAAFETTVGVKVERRVGPDSCLKQATTGSDG